MQRPDEVGDERSSPPVRPARDLFVECPPPEFVEF
jgi:hypothetical protein